MSMFLRIGAVSVVGFAFSTSASVQAMEAAADFDDFLAIDETPLTSTELSEARGGFSFGGFNFDFGVNISPVEAIPAGGLFGDGGVLGNDGVFGDEGVFGDGGVFGDSGGPMGNNNSNQNATPAETVSSNVTPQSVIPTLQSTTPVSQNTTPTVVQTSAPQGTPAPAATPAPAPVTTIAQNSVPTPVATQQSAPQTPSSSQAPAMTPVTNTPAPMPTSMSMQADAPTSGQSNQPPTPTLATTANPSTPVMTVAAAAEEPATTAQNSEASAAAPSMSYNSSSQNRVSQVTQRLGPNGRSVIIDNNMNGVMLRQTIDVNVRVLNFNSRINRAIADTVTATLTSRNLILNSF